MDIAKEIFAEIRSCLNYIEEQLDEIPDCFVSVKEDIAVLEKRFTEEQNATRGIDDLLALIKAHPSLPIIPMVSYDVVADDSYSTWMGTWGSALVDKYLLLDNRVWFYDEDDMEPLLEAKFGYDTLIEMTDNGCLSSYRSMPWTEAIIVSIE